MIDLFSMGGYAAYVWGAYGICALALIALLVVSQRRLKVLERQVGHLLPARSRPPTGETAHSEAPDHAP